VGERMASPPVIEALCEFRFVPTEDWDWTLPGRIYERVKGDFPERADVHAKALRVPVEAGQGTSLEVLESLERVQLKRSDGTAMVQVGANLLVVNQLRPYNGWEQLRSLIARIYSEYGTLSGQTHLARIGLRYINQIDVIDDFSQWAEIVTVAPPLSGALQRTLTGFYQRYEILHDVPPGLLLLQVGNRRQGAQNALMLDLDFATQPNAVPSGEEAILDWLDNAHDRIYESLVASLSEATLRRFGRSVR